ncbi:Alpha/Beta hydrolase protein [Penicillium malachiteum]|uniref:Alpha/Beta hydrolase protein n=1 Tax=Penicillium malachiteum TaxID=1324776 RepID=A0AAD6HBF9_9EURO|nr:Alpha/Beta hydrolase protein [Penicillium malachiteum]
MKPPWTHSSTVKITRAALAHKRTPEINSPYGRFPENGDLFHFIPRTNSTFPPTLEDDDPQKTWATLFDPNPDHWDWGKAISNHTINEDSYTCQGIYFCGYLDVPLDYLNTSEMRIVRLAITKFQVRGLTRLDSSKTGYASSESKVGRKTERTIIIQPGGPGVSGTYVARSDAEDFTNRFSDGQLDVLGWDPRGYREESSPMKQLEISDSMNNAIFYACWKRFGDFCRFVGTASVVRDLEEIRKALGEDGVTGYFVSYGTAIAQTYENMFPANVGRMILDGNLYVKDFRVLGGAGWSLLENGTDIWRDGFLGECINAGPEWCALTKPTNGQSPMTLEQLETRLENVIKSLIDRPLPAYTDKSGPSIITYFQLLDKLRQLMYDPKSGRMLLRCSISLRWETLPSQPQSTNLIICADIVDATPPNDWLSWWNQLWISMISKSWLSGNMALYWVLPCQHYKEYWSTSSEVYVGDLNHTFKTPLLLMSTTCDPATPLRNGRRLLHDMGHNARLIVHHGYGHITAND